MMKFGVRVAEWLARPRRVEAGGRRKATPSGTGGGGVAVGYTFEYINVCNSEFVLEWASAILSGGY